MTSMYGNPYTYTNQYMIFRWIVFDTLANGRFACLLREEKQVEVQIQFEFETNPIGVQIYVRCVCVQYSSKR